MLNTWKTQLRAHNMESYTEQLPAPHLNIDNLGGKQCISYYLEKFPGYIYN
jgi:hypothetical protein